jgi:hypothetical protein
MKNSPTDGEYYPNRAGFIMPTQGKRRLQACFIVHIYQVVNLCACFYHHCGTRLAFY